MATSMGFVDSPLELGSVLFSDKPVYGCLENTWSYPIIDSVRLKTMKLPHVPGVLFTLRLEDKVSDIDTIYTNDTVVSLLSYIHIIRKCIHGCSTVIECLDFWMVQDLESQEIL